MLSKMSAFADISPIGDKKSSRTFQRNFSEEKFLSGRPPRRGFALFAPSAQIHPLLRSETQRKFRALRSATKGSAFGIRKPSRRLDPSFVSWCALKFYVNITWVGQIFIDIARIMRNRILTIRIRISRQLPRAAVRRVKFLLLQALHRGLRAFYRPPVRNRVCRRLRRRRSRRFL